MALIRFKGVSSVPSIARRPNPEADPRGQILVIVAAGFLVIVAAIGLVVDGGMAWGQQRDNQNASDAASEAGAVVLAERLGGVARTDADVLAAVDASIAANAVDKVGAWYTDILGTLIDGAGGPAASTADAADVGAGAIPPNAAGVQANTSKTFDTFLMQVIGRPTLTTLSDATAVAGYIEGVCPAASDCAILPVTIPLNVVTCDGSGDITPEVPPSIWGEPTYFNIPFTIPLCKNDPGNVGWLDWHPPGGGTSELIDAIGPPGTLDYQLTVPGWYHVPSTGNVNSGGVEDALNYYAVNQIPVLIPMFDSTCNLEPPSSGVGACPPGNVGGNGSNQWYHLDRFVAFLFEAPQGAFLQGNNSADCDTGNGATSCLKGMFVRFVGPGATVGGSPGTAGPFSAVGIQLIK
jgi:Putative Flp pilus-assembly TadE/G-like